MAYRKNYVRRWGFIQVDRGVWIHRDNELRKLFTIFFDGQLYSETHEGWRLIVDYFDNGGYDGRNITLGRSHDFRTLAKHYIDYYNDEMAMD